MPDDALPNELIHERSPYLQQHAHNPVAWYPWTDEAFALAASTNRPVFLSIGYATCHWCHVMAHESFEDINVAEFLNDNYICIKLDREEHPDIDAYYMDVCQAITGHGGWPLSIFLDADRKPFFAGTYFPRHSSQNRLGFLDLSKRLKEVWDTDRPRLNESADEIVRAMTEETQRDLHSEISENIFERIADYHRKTFDSQQGGFGTQPKFPSPQHLLLLLRIAKRTNQTDLADMVFITLNAMRAGGIYDQVGFGFHRYSTDKEWLVPHFEKMLYDQAMMMMAYTEAWQVSKNPLYRNTVLEIATYINTYLSSGQGAFYCAQDADSEGEEGKYYVWTADELDQQGIWLHSNMVTWLKQHMGVTSDGNFTDEASGNATGANILNCSNELQTDRQLNVLQSAEWNELRIELLSQRTKRIPPITDTKILADWNGLMIAALAKAGRALADNDLIERAQRAYAHVMDICEFRSDAPLHVGYEQGAKSSTSALLDDWAMMGCAALELFQATAGRSYLIDSERCATMILEYFADDRGRLMMNPVNNRSTSSKQSSTGESGMFYAVRNGTDGAYPSGNSMAAHLFLGLSALTHSSDWKERAHTCVTSYGLHMETSSPAYCMLLCTWDGIAHGARTAEFAKAPIPLRRDSKDFGSSAFEKLNEVFIPDLFITYAELQTDNVQQQVLICSETECLSPLTTETELMVFIQTETNA